MTLYRAREAEDPDWSQMAIGNIRKKKKQINEYVKDNRDFKSKILYPTIYYSLNLCCLIKKKKHNVILEKQINYACVNKS